MACSRQHMLTYLPKSTLPALTQLRPADLLCGRELKFYILGQQKKHMKRRKRRSGLRVVTQEQQLQGTRERVKKLNQRRGYEQEGRQQIKRKMSHFQIICKDSNICKINLFCFIANIGTWKIKGCFRNTQKIPILIEAIKPIWILILGRNVVVTH